MLRLVPVWRLCVCCYVMVNALLQCLQLLFVGMGTMLVNFHMCGIMFFVRSSLNMLLRNASPRGPMCFRCLLFSLSGICIDINMATSTKQKTVLTRYNNNKFIKIILN